MLAAKLLFSCAVGFVAWCVYASWRRSQTVPFGG